MLDCFQALTEVEMSRDRGAFFGSILATANHLLWGDKIWMSRFDGGPRPEVEGSQSTTLCADRAEWSAQRLRMDGRIRLWSEDLDAGDLDGDLTWRSGMTGQTMTRPLALCVAHMFNHQTHHRGQIHAMITASGCSAPVSDLAFMPEA
ncbi:MAG: DinB family protein [Marinibacterium sp.]